MLIPITLVPFMVLFGVPSVDATMSRIVRGFKYSLVVPVLLSESVVSSDITYMFTLIELQTNSDQYVNGISQLQSID